MFEGYWLHPAGEIEVVRTTHIASMIEHPTRFGLTYDEVISAYEAYAEKLGIEGKARHELILKVLALGYIRVRNYGNRGYSITTHRWDRPEKKLVRDWLEALKNQRLLPHRLVDVYAEVRIQCIDESLVIETNLQRFI